MSKSNVQEIYLKGLESYGKKFMSMFDWDTEDDRGETQHGGISSRCTRPAKGDIEEGTDNAGRSDLSRSDEDMGVEPSLSHDSEDEETKKLESIFGRFPESRAREIKGGRKTTSQHAKEKTKKTPNTGDAIDFDALKKERKRFMSHKASVVSHDMDTMPSSVGVDGNPRKGHEPANAPGVKGRREEEIDIVEFRKMQREVHLLGATALDKKSRSAFEASMLAKLGARPQKGPRTAASIGIGMAKKRKKREAAALEEAIAAGMVQRKGMGKKARRKKEANKRSSGIDRGLMEDGGAFRNGVLSLSKWRGQGGKDTRGGHRG